MIPAIHPGEILAEELDIRGVSGSAAARSPGIPQSRISNILRGRSGITADTALRLGRWLGTGPELWVNMQQSYELRMAENLSGREIRESVKPIDSSHTVTPQDLANRHSTPDQDRSSVSDSSATVRSNCRSLPRSVESRAYLRCTGFSSSFERITHVTESHAVVRST